MHSAFLITDSRYWLQAQEEINGNWTLIKAGSAGEPQDWIEWIVVSKRFFFVLRFCFLSVNSSFLLFPFTDF